MATPWGFVLSMGRYWKDADNPNSICQRYFGGDKLTHIYKEPKPYKREKLLDDEDIQWFKDNN